MAKRYKEKSRKKLRYKSTVLLLIILLVIAISIAIYFNNKDEDGRNNDIIASQEENRIDNSIKKEKSSKDKQQDKEELNGDMLNPSKLNQTVLENNEKVKDGEIIKIHYKMQSLEEGNVLLYYKVKNDAIYVVNIDISSKEIKSTKKYEEDDLSNKQVIVDNLSANINCYFERYKDKLNGEGKQLNIIITDTEVILNTNYM